MKIIKNIILGLIFLLPIFFCQVGAELPKLVVLLAIALLSLGAFLFLSFRQGKIEIKTGWLSLAVALFTITASVATALSLNPRISFWGWPTNIGQGLLTLICGAILFFTLPAIFQKSQHPLLALGSGIVVGAPLFYFFNIFGSAVDASIILAILIPLTLGLIDKGKLNWIWPAVGLIAMIAISWREISMTPWIILFFGSAVLLILSFREKKTILFSLSTTFLAAISLVAVVFTYVTRVNYQLMISLAKDAIIARPFLGFGPALMSRAGAFLMDIQIFRGYSAVMDVAVTMGLIGLVAFLTLLAVTAWRVVKSIKNYSILALVMSLILSLLLQSYGLVFISFFWLVLAFVSANLPEKNYVIKLHPFSYKALAIVFPAFLLLIVGLFVVFLSTQSVRAELAYIKKDYQQAAQLGGIDAYWRTYSDYALAQAMQAEKEDEARSWADISVLAAEQAIKTDRREPANFSFQGDLFLAFGEKDLARQSYEMSANLNPFYNIKLAEYYIALFDEDQDEANLDKAEEALRSISSSRPRYEFMLKRHQSFILMRRGQIEEGLALLEEFVSAVQFDHNLWSELGNIYFSQENKTGAESAFRNALLLNPDNRTAHFFMGLIKAEQGKKDEALQHFNYLREKNPEDTTINRIISNLEAGKDPLAGIADSVVE